MTYKFTDVYFTEKYNGFVSLWNKGLKKDANAIAKNLGKYLEAIEEEAADSLCGELCVLKYDKEEIGEFNYFISKPVGNYLEKYAKLGRMPHLRWYYQYSRDFEALEKAYFHKDADDKTGILIGEFYLERLWFASHHMPKSCLCEEKESEEYLCRLETVIKDRGLEESFGWNFGYYKKLFADFWYHSKNFPGGDFARWCEENGRKYHWIKSYYYE